jgi:DNA invertase Pin-like site-specific DNA recombinase
MISNGNKLVDWKLDRLARNMNDLMLIVSQLETKGATLEILDQRIDTASGKAYLQMLGVFAELKPIFVKKDKLLE